MMMTMRRSRFSEDPSAMASFIAHDDGDKKWAAGMRTMRPSL
jgi:hypothetical protein